MLCLNVFEKALGSYGRFVGLQGFTQHSDHVAVDFLVHLPEENLMAAKQEGLLKKFKLTTSISTNNMHLFDAKGVIKKYDTPEQSTGSHEYVC